MTKNELFTNDEGDVGVSIKSVGSVKEIIVRGMDFDTEPVPGEVLIALDPDDALWLAVALMRASHAAR